MLRVAVYGKGGIGKSFVASNLSVFLSREGRRVMHVGCDPKGDSSRNLVPAPGPVPALERLLDIACQPQTVDELVSLGASNVSCIEAGGPEPGEGCGGMGILKLFQFLARKGFFENSLYDVHVYDILGDVVCGGFVAPMKFAAPLTVLVVASEEVHSLYAANQVARAVARFQDKGVRLAGIVLNVRDNAAPVGHVLEFARLLGSRVVATVPRTAAVMEADAARLPALLHEKCGGLSAVFSDIAVSVTGFDSRSSSRTTPLSAGQFDELMAGRRGA